MRNDQIRATYERLAAVREVAGPDAEISLDGHMSFDVETSIRLARALEPLNLKWFEDPVPIANFDAQKRVRDESPIPICAGEMLTPDQFREMIDRRARRHHPSRPAVRGRAPRGQEGRRLRRPQRHPDGDPQQRLGDEHDRRGAPGSGVAPTSSASSTTSGTRSGSRRSSAARASQTFDDEGFVPLTDAPGFGVEIDHDDRAALPGAPASRCSEGSRPMAARSASSRSRPSSSRRSGARTARPSTT